MAHRVVIIGGGFGGLHAARALASRENIDVTLIDRRNFHLFQPLLYQVATGGLSAIDIAYPLRVIFRQAKNIHTLLGEVVDIDVRNRAVRVAGAETVGQSDIAYDSLIVAAGSTHHYFGHAEWERPAPGLKTLEDAQEIRRRILSAFEAGEQETDPERRRAWLTFVIVGGGPTGVELAGALGEIANDTLRGEFRSIRPEEARIFLIEASPRVLAAYPEELAERAAGSLRKLSVLPVTHARVVDVDERGVDIESPDGRRRIEARTVLWAAGVQASPLGAILAEKAGATLDRAGRVKVAPHLTLPDHPEIYVIGDLAGATTAGTAALPALAPVAMQQGDYVGQRIRAQSAGRSTPPFHYRDHGTMATIGRAAAVAEIAGLKLSGWFAWVTWLFVHLMYLVGFQNRLLVLIQWAFQYFTFNRRARLITGPAGSAHSQAPSDAAARTTVQ